MGAILIATATACALAIFFLDELKRAGRDTYRIVAVFGEAPQLSPDATVRIAGHAVGRVVRIEFLPPAPDSAPRIAAVLELPADVRSLIRRDSELHLTSTRPFGPRVIDLVPGTTAAPALRPGDTLRAGAVAAFDDVANEVARFGAALDSLLTTAHAAGRVFAARAPAFRQVRRSLELASAEFERLSVGLNRGPLGQFLDDPRWPAAIRRIRRAVAELGRFFDGATTSNGAAAVDSAGAAATGAAFRRLADRARILGDRLARLEALLAQPRGFPSRLARDSALARALAGARAQLDSLVTEAKSEPWMFIF